MPISIAFFLINLAISLTFLATALVSGNNLMPALPNGIVAVFFLIIYMKGGE